MPIYHYKARNSRGESVSGDMEAATTESVASLLLNSGVTPIDITAVVEQEDAIEELRSRFGRRKPTLDDLIHFCRQMHSLNKAGVPIIRGITGLAETMRNPLLAEILTGIKIELESGKELSLAMSKYGDTFPTIMISLIRVGENTGKLDEAFQQLAAYLELERDTRNRIKAALRYPSFVLIAIAVAIAAVNIWVIPAFAKVFAGKNLVLPWQTKALLATSDFFVAYWPLMLLAVVAAVIGIRYYVRTEEGRYLWDRMKLRLPIVGDLVHRATMGRFARAFAMSVGSGVPLIQALTVVSRAVDNEYVGSRILSMRNGVERGDTLTRTASATGLFTPLVIQMLAVGEETGAVDHMLAEAADFYEREVDYDLKNLTTAIEPILLTAVGILVLILALGIFLPMWDLTQLARQ
jgi:MSHA biogenesis protein MshG